MSTLNVANISDGTDSVPTGYVVNGSAKAWARVYDDNTTPTINQSLNYSSITDLASGTLRSNFTSAMAYSDYHHSVDNQFTSASSAAGYFGQPSTTTDMATYADSNHFEGGSLHYPVAWNVCITGDLA